MLPNVVINKSGHWSLYLLIGDLTNDDEVLGWLIHQSNADEIEEVTDEMLSKLIQSHKRIAVVVCELWTTKYESMDY